MQKGKGELKGEDLCYTLGRKLAAALGSAWPAGSGQGLELTEKHPQLVGGARAMRRTVLAVRNCCDCWRSGVEGVPDQGTLLLLLLLLLGGMIQPNDQDPRDG